ncbi:MULTISPECIES: phosphotransferase family protein [Thermomonospora]|uniref:Aminoglycoside phosphotransferase n=1 Tax=Thermomonospora curvata (strain ATCC 19995 / DSM 43183 / JCM 3096 / KCTC 9072 / NBRC 15933 / NCIMB 10081 / Henssen B9) TaxID=471852 RepID=D1A9E6_THECD|nr:MULTISPECIES: phosphotransferase family protein [Thermomonospora]ACY96842.1 aminoglycoside phosphotransferase [Thermomonospora curvata DSM 43183]PKK15135.1 MAG: phosphotransferase family protein [Thermomonospora sp. CIF 1]
MSGELPAGVPGVDVPRLAAWLERTLPGSGQITGVRLIAGGRSNLTYGITLADGRRVVLRRPPLGHVLPTAHDMAREYRVLSALSGGSGVPVPTPLAFCDDEDVIGARFYVMDHVEGRVLRTMEDAADVTPEQARQLSERLAEVLAAIHTVDVEAAGLADFGRPAGYMARQLKRWGQQWERSREAILATGATRDLPAYERLVRRLGERLPESGPVGLVHGDYRLDNALTRLEPRPEIAAVVDWEMSTLGDPLSDLGLTLVYWAQADDEHRLPVGATVTAAPGFLTRREFAERYAELTKFDLSDIDFYVAFACYKLAVILEGIHARYLQNATVGEGFDKIGDAVPLLLDRAHHILDTGSAW